MIHYIPLLQRLRGGGGGDNGYFFVKLDFEIAFSLFLFAIKSEDSH